MASKPLDRVIVIGGCGFLGHHIVRLLLENNATNVSVLDLRTVRNRIDGADYYDADITSPEQVSSVFEKTKAAVVIHTASPHFIFENRPLFDRVNIQGTDNLLKCAGESGHVKAFIYTSSSSIIHDTISDLIYADETYPVLEPPEQREYYSYTKGVAEHHVLDANRKYGNMLTLSIRPAGIFGEGDVQNLPPVCETYFDGKVDWQIGDNTNLFDFTYVGNVAHAHILAARALLQTLSRSTPPLDHEKVDGEAFLITNDEPIRFWDYARVIWRDCGWKGDAKNAWVIPNKLGMVIATIIEWIYWIIFFGQKEPRLKRKIVRYATMNRTFSIEKAKKRLGYHPIVPLKEGLARGVKWYCNEREALLAAKKVNETKPKTL